MVFERSQIQGCVRTQPRKEPVENRRARAAPTRSLTSSRATPCTTSRISHISLPYSQYSAPPTAHLHTVHQCPSCLSPHFRHRVLLFLRMRQRRLSLCIHAPRLAHRVLVAIRPQGRYALLERYTWPTRDTVWEAAFDTEERRVRVLFTGVRNCTIIGGGERGL